MDSIGQVGAGESEEEEENGRDQRSNAPEQRRDTLAVAQSEASTHDGGPDRRVSPRKVLSGANATVIALGATAAALLAIGGVGATVYDAVVKPPSVAIEARYVSIEDSMLSTDEIVAREAAIFEAKELTDEPPPSAIDQKWCRSADCKERAQPVSVPPRIKRVFVVLEPSQSSGFLEMDRSAFEARSEEVADFSFLTSRAETTATDTVTVRSSEQIWVELGRVAVATTTDDEVRALSWIPFGSTIRLSELRWCERPREDCQVVPLPPPAEDLVYNSRLNSEGGG